MLTEYNHRQINMILDRIKWYENNEISLRKLVDDLEALFNVLENKDKNFENKFFAHWVPLEIIYSCMLSDKRQSLDEEDKKDVKKSLVNLKELIQSYLAKFPKQEDFPEER